MFRILGGVLLLTTTVAQASLPLEASLSDLACGADHVLVGRVVGVDMIDRRGRPVRRDDARTGPDESKTIRLIIAVDETIQSNVASVPSKLEVPLDPFMHYTLGQIREAHRQISQPTLVFLRGSAFQPVIAGRFRWPLEARAEALELRRACRPQSE